MTAPDSGVVTIKVPFAVRKRGGRKLILAPSGAAAMPHRPRVDNAMIKALARAFRWRKLLETGAYGTIEELAAAEEINSSYVSRILRLTLLAPDIVEAVLNGKHAPKVTLATLMQPFSNDWLRQQSLWGSAAFEAQTGKHMLGQSITEFDPGCVKTPSMI